MRETLLFFLGVFLGISCKGLDWEKFGNGSILESSSLSSPSSLFSKSYNIGATLNVPMDIQEESDGYLIAGGDNNKALLFKVEKQTGSVLWSYSYDAGSMKALTVFPSSSGYFLGGIIYLGNSAGLYFSSTPTSTSFAYQFPVSGTNVEIRRILLSGSTLLLLGNEGADILFLKSDLYGNISYNKTYNVGSTENINDAFLSLSGEIIICGKRDVGGGSLEGLIASIDSLGNVTWGKSFSTSTNATNQFYRCRETSDGYIFIGEISGDVFMVKTDNNGTLLWGKSYGSTPTEAGKDIVATLDNGFLFTGESLGVNSDLFIAKIDTSGNLLWVKIVDMGGDERGERIIATSDGYYLIGGYSSTYQGYFLLKTDNQGNIVGSSLNISSSSWVVNPLSITSTNLSFTANPSGLSSGSPTLTVSSLGISSLDL